MILTSLPAETPPAHHLRPLAQLHHPPVICPHLLVSACSRWPCRLRACKAPSAPYAHPPPDLLRCCCCGHCLGAHRGCCGPCVLTTAEGKQAAGAVTKRKWGMRATRTTLGTQQHQRGGESWSNHCVACLVNICVLENRQAVKQGFSSNQASARPTHVAASPAKAAAGAAAQYSDDSDMPTAYMHTYEGETSTSLWCIRLLQYSPSADPCCASLKVVTRTLCTDQLQALTVCQPTFQLLLQGCC